MKTAILVLCCLLAACSMTPTQKKYTALGVSMLVVGFVAAHDSSSNTQAPNPIGKPPGCRSQPDGSCR